MTGVDAALRLDGTLSGMPGSFDRDATFTVTAIEITNKTDASNVFLRAELPKGIDLPGGLIKADGSGFRSATDLEADLRNAINQARVDESFRRLETIQINWKDGTFLKGSFTARGEAKLALRALIEKNDTTAKAIVVAAFRASLTVTIPGNIERTYGIVCRCKFKAETPTLSLDLDDLNLSLPDLKLTKLKIDDGFELKVDVAAELAGVFSFLDKSFKLEAKWDPDPPVFVVKVDGGKLLFAVMKTAKPLTDSIVAADLAQLKAVLTHASSNFKVTAEEVTIAVLPTNVITSAKVTVQNDAFVELNGTRNFGPLKITWEKVRVGIAAKVTASPHELRVRVTFERLMIHPIDDPAAVIAFRGEIELTPSGVAVIELAIVEPYPIELVKRSAAALLRGAQKIIEILGRIDPQTSGDIEGLKKILQVLGKIAAAVARAAIFIAREVGAVLAQVASLLAQAVVKVAELLAALFKELAKLGEGAQGASFPIDVEIRIALEPFELRQLVLSFPKIPATKSGIVSALGFRVEVREEWRPVVLLDFVTEPGAYICAIPVSTSAGKIDLASLSTDLWLGRPNTPVAAIHDGSGSKEDVARPGANDEPLLKFSAKMARDSEVMIVLAGMQRGQAVFFHKGTSKISRVVTIPGTGTTIKVIEGAFKIEPIKSSADFDVQFSFQANRILPLLGMGEAGKKDPAGTGESFLDRLKKSLSQVVTVKEVKQTSFTDRTIKGGAVLEVQAAGVKTEVTVDVTLSLDTFEVTLNAPSVLDLMSQRIEERALGLTWIVEQTGDKERTQNIAVPMFKLAFAGAESGFELNKAVARMEMRFDGLSSDGSGVIFEVTTFRIGRGGLDVVASVIDRAVRLNGINVPFRFTTGRIEIAGGKLVEAVVAGRGQLPPRLIGDANCSVLLAFELVNGEIALKNGSKVELEKMGEPIACHGTRFTLTISHLELSFVREGGYHFYFLVTGSLRFTPKEGEFEDGLLQHLKDIEITLEHAPLTDDPRVLLKHVRFQKELKPKKTFTLFDLFTFELRAFGFHPSSPKFEGKPALNISGQIRFAEIGDVMQPKIDFHELWMAPAKDGESLPRIKADGLGVELQLAGSVKIRGAVLAVDPDTRTVEGRDFAPPGYNTSGFLGEGAVDIPGFCAIEASLGFLEVEKQDSPGDRKLAFFLFLQADKLAVEIPTPVWTFYLREAGFGFGYRFTLAGIKDAENAQSSAQLVRILDDVSKRQGDLARFSAWKPDVEKDNFTLALRGAFQPYPAEKKYDEAEEKKAVSPFFFDIVAALRSDFTFLMSARGWLGVNYASFLENADNFRERPMFRGYLYISVPRSELLLRAIADSKGFIGEDWPEVKEGPLREAVQSVDWTTTLYIRPGLFHYEMGWPDQLSVQLVKRDNMRVSVRGGMIFRAAEDGLLYGYNIGADAFIRFEGRVGGSIGVAIAAELNAKFVARVLAFLAANFRDSLVYGLVALDARLTFSVEAWMDVDLGFTSFTIRIGFSFSVQFTAAVELAITPGGVGGRVEARIAVQVFGCSLSVGIGFTFNPGRLDEARARVQRFLSLGITSEQPDGPPVFGAKQGDKAIDTNADSASAIHKAPPAPTPKTTTTLPPDIKRAKFGRDLKPTDFFLVLRRASVAPKSVPLPDDGIDRAYAFLVPREAENTDHGGFYAAGATKVHKIITNASYPNTKIWIPQNPGFDNKFDDFKNKEISPRLDAPIDVSNGKKDTFTLALLLDECFLIDAKWQAGPPPKRVTTKWKEPKHLRIHKSQVVSEASGEARKQERELQQKSQIADAIAFPHDERAYQARSTVLTMFLDQFVNLAATGVRTDHTVQDVLEAHAVDLGLMLYGPVSELEQLQGAKLVKLEPNDKGTIEAHEGEITVFNKRATWFDQQDPVLADAHHAVEPDGIKLDWRLVLEQANPEQHLHHYEITRTIEGLDFTPYTMKVKPAATVGDRNTTDKDADGLAPNQVRLLAPDWQFIDSLAPETGVSELMRRALLPAFGEGESLEAAKAWIQTFPGQDVTLTYSVTPVDTAGVRGLPRGFTVQIDRPQVQVRPAIGELRMRQTIPKFDDRKGLERITEPPADLEVYLALKDAAWDGPSPKKMPVGGVDYTVERIYRLIVDPEDIEPAGHYGSDATTSRLRGPGAFAATQTADELTFDISRNATVDFKFSDKTEEAISKIEPDPDERKKLPLWTRLDNKKLPGAENPAFTQTKADEFRQALWIRDKVPSETATRVATRFFLQTIVQFTHPTDKKKSSMHFSKRVPLTIDHLITAQDRKPDESQSIAAIRPEAFEWAEPLVLPPLGDGQVDAESGFVRFRSPVKDARLADCLGPTTFKLVRDPERRVLTTVRFAAAPDWAGTTDAKKPLPLHGRSIAGFELYELDLDELAPMDATTKLAKDNKAWKRAHRVARIEQLSPEDAQLVPHGNFDWQGWQAHYPSETERLSLARGDHRKGDSKPILAAWYSDRETTAHFAERRPRIRLLPLVPETAISALMEKGKPSLIRALLVIADKSALSKAVSEIGAPFAPNVELVPVTIDGANLTSLFTPLRNHAFHRKPPAPFGAADLRNLLLCLGWDAPELNPQYLERWIQDPATFDGLTLILTGFGLFQTTDANGFDSSVTAQTGRTEIELNLRSEVHPILEELLAELALKNRGNVEEPALYRHYTVMPQPEVSTGSKDAQSQKTIEGLIANTAPATDPYGWQTLHALGLATTVRLYDLGREAFEPPEGLTQRVNSALTSVLARWRAIYPDPDAITGQVFGEIFLRPGNDRRGGPFDAVISGDLEEEDPDALKLNDEGLAFVQVSLRPRPVAVFTYMRQTLGWEAAKNKNLDKSGKRLVNLFIQVERTTTDVEAARARGGAIAELTEKTKKATFPIGAVRRGSAKDDPELELYFRVVSPTNAAARPTIKLVGEYEIVKVDPNKPVVVTSSLEDITDSPLLIKGDWSEVPEPGTMIGRTPIHPDPFDRFDAIPVERWTEAYKNKPLAKASLDAFKKVAAANGYGFTKVESVVNAFITWSDRFLKNNVSRGARDAARLNDAYVALCAPTKATPWKLAADAEGYITLSFLHSDRWGHVRAYAVKPVSRYQSLLSGIGVKVQQQSDSFVPDTKPGLLHDAGVAVAIAPRTERIEAPVIMSSKLRAKPDLDEIDKIVDLVEIVVARHGEEALANSNRPLLAHTGVPASLISFNRAYRTPDWPGRMAQHFQPSGQVPPVEIHPHIPPKSPVQPDVVRQISGDDVGKLAAELPNLWKGADIWQIPPIPPHYRLIALASERAGIVVSDVTAVVQEEMPREKLEGRVDKLLPEAKVSLLVLRDEGKKARLALRHPTISHAHLTPNGDVIFQNADEKDVARWPDPDVRYVLERRVLDKDSKTSIEKEDAEVRFIPSEPVKDVVIVRALGTDYVEGDPGVVTLFGATPKDGFQLETSVRPNAFDVFWPLGESEFGTPAQIDKFNSMAKFFAAIVTAHAMSIDVPPGSSESVQDYLKRIKERVIPTLQSNVKTKLAGGPERWYRDLAIQAAAKIARLDALKITTETTADQLHKAAPLPILLSAPWRRGDTFTDLFEGGTNVEPLDVKPWTELGDFKKDPGTWLLVFDLASDKEVSGVTAADVPPVAKQKGRLYSLLVDRILGAYTGFWLRAIDTRSRLKIDGINVTAPGVIERRIKNLPACFKAMEGTL